MLCFELVKKVLDELYAQIPGDENTKDAAITAKLSSLRSDYGRLGTKTPTHGSIDYENPVTRFAYIYCYVTSHSNIVYSLIHQSPALQACFDAERLHVTCVGGGPGSDLVGILKYMINANKKPTLTCSLYVRGIFLARERRSIFSKSIP